ncbi:SIR2 family protein [Fructobacillus sp. W13]|uniref:SIR2 family protein n=1 Tax=Fructobacillus apis TaxID=2935017 RepID=A0ABT0ZRH3_9LACO|nr:SIR2 family protein [Fructobacillus apis]MCO0832587.1 SIR2 family protein [Fructobacillus apis]
MDFLSDLKNKNQFPVIFIGSGITQRYFKNALNWDGLLQSLWEETGEEQSYYSRFHELEQQFQKDKFRVYTKLAQELEEKFDTAFYDGKITMQSLSPEEAHQNEMSPFKRRIAEYFEHLEPREEFKNELKLFGKMIRKARMIVTTNYDSLIEDTLFNQISKKVGNRGLFEPSSELNVLYKIHGSIEEPESLVITQRDYEGLKRTSAIVNAKILSELTSSPILFIGYSLTDNNVQSLLKDLADNMPFDVGQSAKRIGSYVKKLDKNKCIKYFELRPLNTF